MRDRLSIRLNLIPNQPLLHSQYRLPLLAQTQPTPDLRTVSGTYLSSSIWQGSVPVESIEDTIQSSRWIMGNPSSFQVSANQNSAFQANYSKLSINQNSIGQISSFQVSTSQVSFSQPSTPHQGTSEISTSQVGSSHSGSTQVGSLQIGIGEISLSQISTPQVSTNQFSSSQVSSSEVNASQLNLSQVSSFQVKSTKIPLPSHISLDQLLSIHNLPIASKNTYKDNPLNLWNTLFDPTTPFDINFIVKDLPTGQLAEAQISKFSFQWQPIGGDILIDPDFNSKG